MQESIKDQTRINNTFTMHVDEVVFTPVRCSKLDDSWRRLYHLQLPMQAVCKELVYIYIYIILICQLRE